MAGRRTVLKTLAGAGLATAASTRRVLGASDRVRVGLIGNGLIGKRHLLDFKAQSDVEIVAVCEVCDARLEEAAAAAGSGAGRYKDFRRLLDRSDVDAVVVSTPDHWHARMTILACAAGKDVYVEKPLTHAARETAMAVLGFALLVALAQGLLRVLSARAAWIHVGATMGTIMAANVWQQILPTQRRMIAALAEGGRLDPALEDQAMLRTRHNTYLSVPLLLVMLSNHFPTASYGHSWSAAMLGLFLLLGFAAVHVMRRL